MNRSAGLTLKEEFAPMGQLKTPSPAPPSNCDDDWKITCHEAGHAIVAVLHEITFDSVHRGDGEDNEVEVNSSPLDDENDDWTDDTLRQWQQFCAAGAAAERLLFQNERQHAIGRDKFLHEKLEQRLNRHRADGFDEDVRAAMRLLDPCLIDNVAKELATKRKLTYDEVANLIEYRPSWEGSAPAKK
jgi:hypothetical protein